MSTTTTELARREERAQGGIIQFAEEMQAIRDGNLYPGAKQAPDAWGIYCKARWSLSRGRMDDIIRAAPVLRRRALESKAQPTVEKARIVATLPVAVQDAILDDQDGQIHEHDVGAKAKAARAVAKAIEQNEGREATPAEQIEAAASVAAKKPKRKPKMKASKFVSNLAQAHWHLEQAANIAHNEQIDDVENDYGWAMTSKVEYEIERLREKLYQPEIVKDADEAFAELLGGDEK